MLLRVTQELIRNQSVSKRHQKKINKMKPVSDDIGISTWEICSDESSTVWRELRKATAKPKQATVMWI